MKETMEQKQPETSFQQCAICAYQESGHILFAYLSGFSCKQAELVQSSEEEFCSTSIFDYGKNKRIADNFLSQQKALFSNLSFSEKSECLEVGQKLALLFMGGSVATAIFRNDGNPHIPLPIQLEYSDLRQVEFISHVIESLETDSESQFIENCLQDALYTLSNINIWETVTDLVERLLENRQLNQNDIEECLEEHGIIFSEASPL